MHTTGSVWYVNASKHFGLLHFSSPSATLSCQWLRLETLKDCNDLCSKFGYENVLSSFNSFQQAKMYTICLKERSNQSLYMYAYVLCLYVCWVFKYIVCICCTCCKQCKCLCSLYCHLPHSTVVLRVSFCHLSSKQLWSVCQCFAK